MVLQWLAVSLGLALLVRHDAGSALVLPWLQQFAHQDLMAHFELSHDALSQCRRRICSSSGLGATAGRTCGAVGVHMSSLSWSHECVHGGFCLVVLATCGGVLLCRHALATGVVPICSLPKAPLFVAQMDDAFWSAYAESSMVPIPRICFLSLYYASTVQSREFEGLCRTCGSTGTFFFLLFFWVCLVRCSKVLSGEPRTFLHRIRFAHRWIAPASTVEREVGAASPNHLIRGPCARTGGRF